MSIHYSVIRTNYLDFEKLIKDEAYLQKDKKNIIELPLININENVKHKSMGVDKVLYDLSNDNFLMEKQQTIIFYNSKLDSLIFFGDKSFGFYLLKNDFLIDRMIPKHYMTYNTYISGNAQLDYKNLNNITAKLTSVSSNYTYGGGVELVSISNNKENLQSITLNLNIKPNVNSKEFISTINGEHVFSNLKEVKSYFEELSDILLLHDLTIDFNSFLNKIEFNIDKIIKNKKFVKDNMDFFTNSIEAIFISYFNKKSALLENRADNKLENVIDYFELFSDLSTFTENNLKFYSPINLINKIK